QLIDRNGIVAVAITDTRDLRNHAPAGQNGDCKGDHRSTEPGLHHGKAPPRELLDERNWIVALLLTPIGDTLQAADGSDKPCRSGHNDNRDIEPTTRSTAGPLRAAIIDCRERGTLFRWTSKPKPSPGSPSPWRSDC